MQKVLLILVSFVITYTFAQQPDTLKWTKNRIATAVFPKAKNTEKPAEFVARLAIRLEKQRYFRTQHVHYVTEAQWLRNECFITDSVQENYLLLAQLLFDCYELESRRLQERINVSDAQLDREITVSMQQIGEQVEALCEVTQNGENLEEMSYWRKWMDSTLLATPRFFLPNFNSGKYEIGIDIRGGFSRINGSLSDYFRVLPGVGYGVGVRLKRCSFDHHSIYNYGRSKQSFSVADFAFSDSNRLQINQTSWTVGVQLLQSYKWSVIPYAGLSTFRVINRDIAEGSLFEKGRISYNWETGLITEWRFLHVYQSNDAQVFWKLLVQVGYAPINYLYKVKGDALNVRVGIGITLKSIVNLPNE